MLYGEYHIFHSYVVVHSLNMLIYAPTSSYLLVLRWRVNIEHLNHTHCAGKLHEWTRYHAEINCRPTRAFCTISRVRLTSDHLSRQKLHRCTTVVCWLHVKAHHIQLTTISKYDYELIHLYRQSVSICLNLHLFEFKFAACFN